MSKTVLAVVDPPGVFIEEELKERKWSQLDLAEVLGRSPRLVNELITGKRSITPETAKGLSEAFGTDAELWMNLESLYQLSKVKRQDDGVARRAQLFSAFPVREMTRRGWIKNSDNLNVLEKDFLKFFNIKNISDTPSINSYLRKSGSYKEDLSIDQKAWLFRVFRLCEKQKVPAFSVRKLDTALAELKLNLDKSDLREIPKILNNAGIHFLIVETLPGNKIDGVCFWVNNGKNPVIALTLRADRIDSFWFTLLHECAHIKYKHGQQEIVPDTNLVGRDAEKTSEKPEAEKQADYFASEFIIDEEALIDFAEKVSPYFSKRRISEFADELCVHPGLVVGQLQYREYIPYSHSREMLEKVREQLIPVAMTDGWGIAPK